MASNRITVRVPGSLGQRLRHRSRVEGQAESVLIREALENYLGREGEAGAAYDLAEGAGLIGCVGAGRGTNPKKRPPKDLSTNPRHMEGLGR